MKPLCTVLCAGLILLGAATLCFGQLQPDPDDPTAVYAELQTLQEQADELDRQITEAEHELERARAAVANQQYVRDRNAALIERLEKWVDSE